MSSLVKRGPKKVYYLYWVENGKNRGKSLHTSIKDVALDIQKAHDTKMAKLGAGIACPEILWEEYCREYLDEYSAVHKGPRSRKRDEITIRTFNRLVPLHTLGEFSIRILHRYMALRKGMGVSEATINRELNTLTNMGKIAKKWRYLDENPVRDVGRYQINPIRKRRVLTPAEVKQLVEGCSGIWLTIVMVGIYAGLRLGEILHLSWADVDFERGFLSVTAKDGWRPKDNELRDIELHPELERYLRELKRRAKPKHAWVACYPDGSVPVEETASAMIRKICRKLELKDVTTHTFRHTFASNALDHGLHLKTVQEWLGHKRLQTTEIYSHLTPERRRSDIRKISYNTDDKEAST